jgi:uncharacterized membrane protein YozB (DUF420 family)
MTAYAVTLLVHSYLRWAIFVLALAVILRAAQGWASRRDWSPLDERVHRGLVSLVDLQFLLGLGLYLFLSPFSAAFLNAPGAGTKNAVLRFFGLEHPVAMIVALALLHIGWKRSRGLSAPHMRHRCVFRWTLAGTLALFLGTPWPPLPYGRPLLRTDVASRSAEPTCQAARPRAASGQQALDLGGDRGRGREPRRVDADQVHPAGQAAGALFDHDEVAEAVARALQLRADAGHVRRQLVVGDHG